MGQIRRKKRLVANPEPPQSREALEAQGQVWDTKELGHDFVLTAIIGDRVVVRRKTDNVVGTLRVQENPRLYFDFRPQQTTE
jgi:hypothetical protein